jgi:hypothetical protein
VKRRDFLKSTAVITGGGLLPRYGASAGGISSNAVPGARPNILFILVDELRYPRSIRTKSRPLESSWRSFMPNLYKRIWQVGVKFGNHNTAANPGRPQRRRETHVISS